MTDKSTEFHQKMTLNAGGTILDLSTPVVMGILNLTPDSFYDGGRNNTAALAIERAGQMLADGAAILDLGAYSSRPGAADISTGEEILRLLPVLRALVKAYPRAIISVDTFRSEVAQAAIGEGAHIINDISGGSLDPQLFETVARLKVPYVLMHMKGTPQNMVQHAHYHDLFDEIFTCFTERLFQLGELGVTDILIDPGFGFAKTPEQSYRLLSMLEQFKAFGHPVLAGLSRKSMIYKKLGVTAAEALNGTTVLNTIALQKGANILRVHDVKEAAEAIKLVSLTFNV
ncbi:dihydropteroate synthase [Hufsiella ginkgonis]|uniref:Dihydropteroate synthase n=1 Tax=Hufsiella ginkgonis TaxID=2695274 RepID=A0A7K1Y207_9SPHI|nr:dihydropteroate synthase [Hufsiella ginkgonis]MXV17127.1 dihydropteroate synthase [Hufsiella ginkgonis]